MALMPRLRQLMRRQSSASTVGARRPTSADTARRHRARGRAARHARRRPQRRAGLPGARRDRPATGGRVPRLRGPARGPRGREREAAGRGPRGLGARGGAGRVTRAAGTRSSSWAGSRSRTTRRRALRRLATAAERDPSGRALAESMEILREAHLPVEALGLGVGHWRAREHTPEAGRQLVLAAIDADRIVRGQAPPRGPRAVPGRGGRRPDPARAHARDRARRAAPLGYLGPTTSRRPGVLRPGVRRAQASPTPGHADGAATSREVSGAVGHCGPGAGQTGARSVAGAIRSRRPRCRTCRP